MQHCRLHRLSCGRQKERTQEQQAAFDRALQSMDLLYAHQEAMVWRMTRLLDGYGAARPYSDRGWVCRSSLKPSAPRLRMSRSLDALQTPSHLLRPVRVALARRHDLARERV